MSPKRANLIAGCIIAVGVILAIASVWHDSLVVDEDPHIGAGYSYLTKQDMRLNPEHPPLAKDLSAIPLLFLNLDQSVYTTKQWMTDVNGQWDFGRRLIFNSGNDADLITHAAKLPMLLLYIISAWILFVWTRDRYGLRSAFIALVLFVFSPNILAHARFVTTDVAALTGVLTATFTFVRYLKAPTRKNLWIASVVFGLAMLMKFSTILLGPFFIVLALIYSWRTLGKTVLVMAIGFIVVVWPVYYFHTLNYPPSRQHQDTKSLLQSFGNRTLADPVVWMSDKPVIRAAAQYGLGLLMVVQRSAGGNTVFFNGKVLTTAGPIYFPYIYAIKEPLPWLALLVIAIVMAITKFQVSCFKFKKLRSWLHDHLDESAMLLWLVIYWATSIHSTLNIGVRHLMPIYPFMIMLAAGVLGKATRRSMVVAGTVVVMLGWYIVENLSVFPLYLTYFNETVGGPSGGYQHVTDSNLDWGQDLRRFSDWVIQHDIKKIELDYFGWADPSYYLKDRFLWLSINKFKGREDFLQHNTSDGWIAVSVTFLQQNRDGNYAWLSSQTPIVIIGHSIYVYQIK